MGLTKCPNCGRTISDHVETCPGCGYYPRGRNFYPGKPKPTAIPVRCPWCGEMVPAGEKSCPGCGSPAKVTYSMAANRLEPIELEPLDGARDRGPIWLYVLLAALLVIAIVWSAVTLRRNRTPPEPATAGEVIGALVVADARERGREAWIHMSARACW